jgi:hypothetical protein
VSEISERYVQLSADFITKVASVPANCWMSPSPCERMSKPSCSRSSAVAPGPNQLGLTVPSHTTSWALDGFVIRTHLVHPRTALRCSHHLQP